MRWLIIGGILALVVTVYALVDLTVTDDRRIRRLNRVLWVVLIVVLPLAGALGWLTWGKGPRATAPPMAPDDDPSFSRASTVSTSETDRRIAEIEAQLAALDDEDFRVEPEAKSSLAAAAESEPEAPPAAEPEPDAVPPKATAPKKQPADDADGQEHRAPDGGDAARA
ncbi:PLDc N-terminal domain-containing protein [Agrococcus sp. Ld7]|uniref:PLDc N-terminal domain-containing protein n=1 Tax=Agrococcus sp. Ld7 TaxID=649148 RepID=UPI00386BFCC1